MGQTKPPWDKCASPSTAPEAYAAKKFWNSHHVLADEYSKKMNKTLKCLNKARICSQEHEDQISVPGSRYGLLMGRFEADTEEFRTKEAEDLERQRRDHDIDSEGSFE